MEQEQLALRDPQDLLVRLAQLVRLVQQARPVPLDLLVLGQQETLVQQETLAQLVQQADQLARPDPLVTLEIPGRLGLAEGLPGQLVPLETQDRAEGQLARPEVLVQQDQAAQLVQLARQVGQPDQLDRQELLA